MPPDAKSRILWSCRSDQSTAGDEITAGTAALERLSAQRTQTAGRANRIDVIRYSPVGTIAGVYGPPLVGFVFTSSGTRHCGLRNSRGCRSECLGRCWCLRGNGSAKQLAPQLPYRTSCSFEHIVHSFGNVRLPGNCRFGFRCCSRRHCGHCTVGRLLRCDHYRFRKWRKPNRK